MAPDTSTASDADAQAALADIERLGGQLRAARAAIGRVIYGQQDVIDQTLVALLSGGHLLLIGVPGLAKTKLVETLGTVLGMNAKRIQFTPDLMPADILGSEVLDESETGRRSFRFVPGPVFCQLLMADEINRASPRTQSALLQAMQEQRVTVGGVEHALPRPFHVLATQNPIESEGVYPLPEAVMAAVCSFNTLADAVNTTIQIIQMGVPIARCELLDDNTVRIVNQQSKLTLPEGALMLMGCFVRRLLCGVCYFVVRWVVALAGDLHQQASPMCLH